MVSRTTDYEKRASAFLLERSKNVAKSNASLVKSQKVRRILNRTVKMKGGLRWRNLFRKKQQAATPHLLYANTNYQYINGNNQYSYAPPVEAETRKSRFSTLKMPKLSLPTFKRPTLKLPTFKRPAMFTRKNGNSKAEPNSFLEENPLSPRSRINSAASDASDPGPTRTLSLNNTIPEPTPEETVAFNAREKAIQNIMKKLDPNLLRSHRVALAQGNALKLLNLNRKVMELRKQARNMYEKQSKIQNF